MSVVKTIDIRCDWPDCYRIGESDGIVTTAVEARRQLRSRGWARRRRDGVLVDLCPTHVWAADDEGSP